MIAASLLVIGLLQETPPVTDGQMALIVAILGALGTFIVALINARNAAKAANSAAKKSDIEGFQAVIEQLRKELDYNTATIDELRKEVDQLRDEVSKQIKRNKGLLRYIEKLLDVIKKLTQQLKDNGCEPCAEPPEWTDDDEQDTQPRGRGAK